MVRILANGFCGRAAKERKVVAISVESEEAIFVFHRGSCFGIG